MKYISISDENYEKLCGIAGSKGVDEALTLLFSKIEEVSFPQITYTPPEFKEVLKEIMDSDKLDGIGLMDYPENKFEIALEIQGGGVIFSKSHPYYSPSKSQSFDWALRNLTLKRFKERKIKRVEISELPESKRIPLSATNMAVDAHSISQQLGLIYNDFLKLEPSISIKLNNYLAYEYTIKFNHCDYPDYFKKYISSNGVYKINHRKLYAHDMEISEGERAKGMAQLKVAFLARHYGMSFNDASKLETKLLLQHDSHDELEVVFEDGTQDSILVQLSNKKLHHSFLYAFPFSSNINMTRLYN